jgi:hypothetical protein
MSKNKPARIDLPAKLLPYPIQIIGGLRRQLVGGGERNRTDDLLLAKQALSQLSYTPVANHQLVPVKNQLVGQGGFEPPTSRLSSARSNQLSY